MFKHNYYKAIDFGMGTVIEQEIFSMNKDVGISIHRKALELIKKLEASMSFFIPSSFVSLINTSYGESETIVDADLFYVLKSADKNYKASSGAFDITSAPLTSLWRSCIKEKTVPTDTRIKELAAYVSGKGMELNESKMSVKLGREQSIDLGGIGKGYAADRVIEFYRQSGINSGFVNLGGNVKTLGNKANGNPWTIGLQNPRSKRGDYIALIMLTDSSMVTSGDYEKYFMMGSKRFHHIVDPETGYPAYSNLMSVSVISQSSMEADALSTAGFILGLEKGMELIEAANAGGIFITKDRNIYISKILKDIFFFKDHNSNYKFYYF